MQVRYLAILLAAVIAGLVIQKTTATKSTMHSGATMDIMAIQSQVGNGLPVTVTGDLI